ncbi:hypothetical protein D0N36_14150 [Hymenobacter lapidiphilus]|uniref:hypothetical protein n=1 Tax=Hymenobacter sp. CCM 8763 TaxID=2303334 RepID=UPI000E352435|nr:hypothetical protein [Hymenobacter sp. CCM 8763]RFP64456.1 hypothetical protein D0N36_14150 [Hymenobacter sp. CCM 8763]
MKKTESYPEQLCQFTLHVLLPAVPRLTWWVLGLIGFSGLNLLFSKELWPHFPRAANWFWFSMMPCLAVLPWLGAYTAKQLRQRVRQWWWRGLWQLATIGAYLVAIIGSLGLIIFSLIGMVI